MISPRAIILDMDGVLWQSTDAHAAAFRTVLAGVGVTDFSYATIAGQRTKDALAGLLEANGIAISDDRLAALAERKTQLSFETLALTNPVTPLATVVLERLASRFPLALATSGSAASAHLFLDRNALAPLFSAVVTGSDVAAAKPAPDIFLEAARRLGIPPAECLVVEDSSAGVAAARAAGCRVVLFRAGPAPGEKPTPLAEGTISSLSELIAATGGNAQGVWEDGDWRHTLPPADPRQWTTVIPAAGRGTRLGFDLPKVLFPIAGRPLLDWLLDRFGAHSAKVIVVCSPSGQAAVRQHLESYPGLAVETALQPEPLGMGDAIACGLAGVNTPNVLVVWGDQAALRQETIDSCLRLHEATRPLATVPVLWRSGPYIHFSRQDDRLVRVLQAREGDVMPTEGESDTGLFLFRTSALRRFLPEAADAGQLRGRLTQECNLLPLLPLLDSVPGNVVTARVATSEESIGVNTREEAAVLAGVLAARRAPREAKP